MGSANHVGSVVSCRGGCCRFVCHSSRSAMLYVFFVRELLFRTVGLPFGSCFSTGVSSSCIADVPTILTSSQHVVVAPENVWRVGLKIV